MDIQKLRSLVLLAETGSYSVAAERLYTSQSNVSKQIQALERELNVPLVDRTHRTIRLTTAGETAVGYARRMVSDSDAMLAELGGRASVLRLASLPVMAHYGITALLTAFRRRHPEVELAVEEVDALLRPEELSGSRYELAFLRTRPEEDRFEKRVLCRDRLTAAVPLGHPLAARSSLRLEELSGERMALLDQSSALYDLIWEACGRAGFAPDLCYTGRRIENILELVAGGFAVSLLMDRAARYVDNPQVKLVPLEEMLASDVSLVRPRGRHSRLSDQFWDFVGDRDAGAAWNER